MKEVILGIVGAVGSAIASFFGGWDAGLTTLLIFMAVDYLSGLIVAGVFHKSNKTDTGSLESKTCWICEKHLQQLQKVHDTDFCSYCIQT